MDDELWALIVPLLPPRPQKAPGPKPTYVLYNDISWQLLPLEMRVRLGAGLAGSEGARRAERAVA